MTELVRLGVPLDVTAMRAGLTDARWPGRLERVRWRGADVLLDAAHNPAGARALADYLREIGWRDVTLVVGAMRDKDVAGMLTALLPWLCSRRVHDGAEPARARRRVARGACVRTRARPRAATWPLPPSPTRRRR